MRRSGRSAWVDAGRRLREWGAVRSGVLASPTSLSNAIAGRSTAWRILLPLWRTSAIVTEVALWRLAEVDLRESQHLLLIDVIDVDSHVSH